VARNTDSGKPAASFEALATIFALNPLVNPEVVANPAHRGFRSQRRLVLRVLMLVLLFAGAAVYESVHLSSLTSSEVWVHLRTGTWMLENHAVPRSGVFSQYPNLPWTDATWGFDLLLGIAYRIFGLRGIPLLLMGLKVAVAGITFLLVRSGRATFWQAVALSAIAQYVLWGLQPLAYVFSILLFAVELRLLLRSRNTGSVRELYWLPALFFVWANLHVQFVLGLMLLAVFLIAQAIELWLRMLRLSWLSPSILPLPFKQVCGIAAVCLLATCVTPYGYRPLATFFDASYSQVAFQHFAEMSAMTFRRPQDYILMLLAMMAFLALGRRRSLDLFQLLVLLGGTAVAFRIQRDGWMAVLAAVGVLSTTAFFERHGDEQQPGMASAWKWGVVVLTAIVIVIAGLRLPNHNALMNRVRSDFPVAACDFIVSNRLPQPLFHEYAFGSFLTWYLPQYPVVVDNRVELYGDRILGEYFDVVGGKERLEDHSMIARAGTLLLQRNSAIDKALRNLPALRDRYRLVYSDDLADIFVPQSVDPSR
jgi:hypothetical protein